MALTVGTRLGSHEITALLGKGGMGEVYRARDAKLKRQVAIKILPDEFSQDLDRVSRFQREAEVLASLNHPNIAAIYDLGELGDSRYLVLELVEGETLADRLKRGALPIEEALNIAKSICEALEAAHEKGIVHRDLKPPNVKITPDGKVKVLDFGLAKALEKTSNAVLSNSPTLMTAASSPGMILGTAAYMSPEQAKGRDADRTSDIWAFGCVLYEMLTGHAVFEGETIGEILGGVFKAEPDWNRLPVETPRAIRRLLGRCLQKDRNLRLRDAADARLEILEPRGEVELAAPQAKGRERLAWIAFAAAFFAAVGLAIPALRHQSQTPPLSPSEVQVEIITPPTTDPISLAISPDGQKIVFVAAAGNRSQLWVRPLGAVSAQPLPGSDGAIYPFWSPDSRSVGFFADAKLKLTNIDGGSVQTLADAPASRGGSWNRDGTIIFSPSGNGGPMFRVSATGGDVSPLTRLAPQQTNHRFPQFLPDGDHFLYYAQGSSESRGIYIGRLNGSETRRLLDADSAAVYASSGQLLFVRQATLFAQNFDPDRLKLSGNPFPVVEGVALSAVAQGAAALSASIAGPIVYRSASVGGPRQLIWFDRSGKEIEKAGAPNGATSVSISIDGRSVALSQQLNQNFDIWLLDLGRGVLSRFTFDPAVENNAV